MQYNRWQHKHLVQSNRIIHIIKDDIKNKRTVRTDVLKNLTSHPTNWTVGLARHNQSHLQIG